MAAAFAAGAGVIGDYRECSFAIPGEGTFFGTEATDPTVGQRGRRESVAELRLEFVCPADRLAAVLAATRAHHSYEEPAIDVYPLHDGRRGSRTARMPSVPGAWAGSSGRVGLADFAAIVGRTLDSLVRSDRRRSATADPSGGGLLRRR